MNLAVVISRTKLQVKTLPEKRGVVIKLDDENDYAKMMCQKEKSLSFTLSWCVCVCVCVYRLIWAIEMQSKNLPHI